MKQKWNRPLALLLSAAMLFSMSGTPVYAVDVETGASAVCPHHVHDETCGYSEGTPCTHEHTDDCYTLVTECVHEHTAECYPAETEDGAESGSEDTATPSDADVKEASACTHVCSVESGCITKELNCQHVHDETCGYSEGSPCTFDPADCEICNPTDSGEPEAPAECTCETLCTADSVDPDCPVCGAEGADLADCTGAAPALLAKIAQLSKLVVGGTTVVENSQTTENTSGQGWSYDVDSNTLTLNEATINGTDTTGHVGAGIYAEGDLTIVLEGSSTVTGVQDPNGESQSIRVSGNLTIQGGGSLTAQGAETSSGSSYGIFVTESFTQQSGSVTAIGGDVSGSYNSEGLYVYGSTVTVERGTLTATGGNTSGSSYGIYARGTVTVNDAIVTATGGSGNASYGLYIDSSSPSVTLSGGSLTARSGSGTDTAVGIYLNNIWSSTGSVTVGNGSTLLTNSVIFGDSSFNENPLAPTGDGSWLIYGQSNQTKPMQGDVTLPDDLTIPSGAEVTIPAGSTLTVPQGKTLTVNGTLNIANQSSLTGDGTLDGSGAFNLTNPDPVISGSDTLTYDGTDQFSKFTLTAPSGTVDVMGQAFNISDSPSLEGWTLDTQVIKDAGNYTVTANHTDGRTIQKQVTVNKATSSISINNTYNPGKTYDGTALANPTESELTLTGAGYNDVTFTWYEGTSPNGTKLDSAPTDAGTYYLVASIAESNNTSGSSKTSGAITISPAAISIKSATVQEKTYDGTTTATVGTVTFTGLVNGESLTSGTDYNATAAFTDKSAGNSKQATVTVELKNGNYTFANSEKTATANATTKISPLAVALSWSTPTSFTYDGSEKTVTAIINNAVSGDDVSVAYDSNSTTKATAANEYTATVSGLSGNDANNYTLTGADNLSQSWSISGASIADAEVTLSQNSFTYTGSEQKPTVTVKLGDTPLTESDYTVTYSGNCTDAGTYTVTVTGKGNYSGTANTQPSYTINKADQAALSITSTGPATFGQNYTLTTSGGSGSGSVTFTVTDGTGAATVSGDTLTPTKAGTVTVTAVKAGDNNYNDGTSVSVTITINKGTYDGTKTAAGSVLANWPGEVTLPAIPDGASYGTASYSGSDLTGLTVSGGKLSYTGGSGIVKDQTYTVTVPVTGATNYVDYDIIVTLTGTDKQPQTVTISGQPGSVVYGDSFTLTASAPGSGAVSWSASGCASVDASGKVTITGAGEFTITAAVAEDDTYTADTDRITMTAGKKALTITAKNQTVVQNQTMPELTYEVSGLVKGDTFTNPTITTTAKDTTTQGKYDILISGGTLTNADCYDVSYVDGSLEVIKQSGGGSSSSGSGSSGGGSSSGSDSTIINRPDADDPTTPTTAETKPVKADSKGEALLTGSMVSDAISVAQSDARKNGNTANGIAVVVPVEISGTLKDVQITLKADALDKLVSSGVKRFTVDADRMADFGFTLDTLKELNRQTSGDVILKINAVTVSSEEAKAAIGSRPVYDMTLCHLAGGKETPVSLSSAAVSVAIPYTPAKGESTGNLYAVYVDENGKVEWLTKSSYDADQKAIIFEAEHFSFYGVGYRTPVPSFTDISDHWAEEHILFTASRGLFSGTSETTFSPNATLTRGMFVTALGRLAGIDPADYQTGKFTDVKADAYYAPYVNWAAKTGIVSGTTSTTFAPDSNITREQMAVIMKNYADKMGYSVPKTLEAVTFVDNAKISYWAKDAVKAMQQAGVLSGKSNNQFDPKGNATRAEAATVLHRFVEVIIDPQTANGWTQNDSGEWSYYQDGEPIRGWVFSDQKWYWLDKTTGKLFCGGWKQIDGKWYYFYADGSMAVSTKVDGYEVGADGTRIG